VGERRFTRHAVSVGLCSGRKRCVPTQSGKPVLLPILVGQLENAPRPVLRMSIRKA
jgi:hypothetical protein